MTFLKLIRYKNLLMVLLTMVLTKYALIHSFIENSYLTNFQFFVLVLSVLLITSGGYIVNDIYDIEADKINKPNKVFIGVSISEKSAWISYLLLTFFGFLLGVYLSITISVFYFSFIFLFVVFGLFFYSKYLKKKNILGNTLVSTIVALTIYIIYLFILKHINFIQPDLGKQDNSLLCFQVWLKILSYSFFAFLSTLIREIIKDIEDIDGDLKINAKTLPIVLGRKRAVNLVFFLTLVLLVFLTLVIKNIKIEQVILSYGIFFLLLPLLYFMYKLLSAKKKNDFSKLSGLMKLIMLLGIISMLLFKVN